MRLRLGLQTKRLICVLYRGDISGDQPQKAIHFIFTSQRIGGFCISSQLYLWGFKFKAQVRDCMYGEEERIEEWNRLDSQK